MINKLSEILLHESESTILDFKQEQYPLGKAYKKNELLKDISAFANHLSDSDKYIIVGVVEKGGLADRFISIENLVDESKYQELVNKNIEPEINFEYKTFDYEGCKLAYFRIFDNRNRPYLFKKDLKNPINQEIEYRAGDGFTRIGTSTKKLDRSDFDRIYASKYKAKDRKEDLEITTCFGIPENQELTNFDVRYLDLDIENLSNQSIEFDIEMKVFRPHTGLLISQTDLTREIRNNSYNGFGGVMYHPVISNLYVSFDDHEGSLTVIRNRLRHNKTAVALPQRSKEKRIFDEQLLAIFSSEEDKPKIIKAEVILRSDNFIDGCLVKEVEFHI
ncbi:helix-turn-helix domain-containing protein [Pontibacter litorisediminis]|uniref:AlbA family DNA-binding domain-containing protein n=1 Tax=Pontibacter litorisediminis TaxID=1846260 RepID=UPI0023EB6C4C|nr:ATP-binding protein [Pontibacter litorisediminis]